MKSLIICSNSVKVSSKQSLGVILMSIFSDKAFQNYLLGWKEISLEILFESFYLTYERFAEC